MKRFSAIILAMVIAVSCLSVNALAAGFGQPSAVYLNEMTGLQSFSRHGKIWFHTNSGVYFSHDERSWILDTPGVISPAQDSSGSRYTYGLHLDGTDTGPYYISIPLNRNYSAFSCTVACASIAGAGATTVSFYVDGLWVKSATAYSGSSAVKISLPLSGNSTLRIEYAVSDCSNDHAVLYDALLFC